MSDITLSSPFFAEILLVLQDNISGLRAADVNPEDTQEILRQIDTALTLIAYGCRRTPNALTPKEYSVVVESLQEVDSIMHLIDFARTPFLPRTHTLENYLEQKEIRHVNQSVIIALFIDLFREARDNWINEPAEKPETEEAVALIEKVSRFVPEQKVSPVHFDFTHEHRLTTLDLPAAADSLDRANVEAARSALATEGRSIIDDLRRSNCDRRLLASLEKVQALLEAAVNVVQLAIVSTYSENIRKAAAPEISSTLNAVIVSHLEAVSQYVSQFPEWQRYTQNAVLLEIGPTDIIQLISTADSLITVLENDELVDESVPSSIKFIRNSVSQPGTESKRVTFALVRTLENLFSRVCRYIGDLFVETAQSFKSHFTKNFGISLSVGLMGVIAHATGLTALFARIPGAAWLAEVVPVIAKYVGTNL